MDEVHLASLRAVLSVRRFSGLAGVTDETPDPAKRLSKNPIILPLPTTLVDLANSKRTLTVKDIC